VNAGPPALETEGLGRRFGGERTLLGRRRRVVRALEGVSLRVPRGETLGLVGESGCGKTTLAKVVVGLLAPSAGRVALGGDPVDRLSRAERHRRAQLVFQDPASSLNPRKRVGSILEAPLRALVGTSPAERHERVAEALAQVGLEPRHAERFPHEFSGGQAQRVAIARALITEPALVVLDEAVSALDVTVQARILELLARLQAETGVAYLFISHDLAVVDTLAHRVAVMYLGRVVEAGSARQVLGTPKHPYTRVLLSAVPVPGRRARPIALAGEPPSPHAPPPGCVFHPRCYRAEALCSERAPPLVAERVDHPTACFFADDSEVEREQARGGRSAAAPPADGP